MINTWVIKATVSRYAYGDYVELLTKYGKLRKWAWQSEESPTFDSVASAKRWLESTVDDGGNIKYESMNKPWPTV